MCAIIKKERDEEVMNKKSVVLWFSSMVVFALSLIPFVLFMFKPSVANLSKSVVVIAVAAILYVIGTKQMTHDKGYTTVQAIIFYKQCCKQGFDDIRKCKKNPEKIKEIASKYDYLVGFDIKVLYEIYAVGCEYYPKKKG